PTPNAAYPYLKYGGANALPIATPPAKPAAGPIQRPRCQRRHCTDSTAVASAFLSASDEANGAAPAGAASHDVTPAITGTARIFQDLPMTDLHIVCNVAPLRQCRDQKYKATAADPPPSRAFATWHASLAQNHVCDARRSGASIEAIS